MTALRAKARNRSGLAPKAHCRSFLRVPVEHEPAYIHEAVIEGVRVGSPALVRSYGLRQEFVSRRDGCLVAQVSGSAFGGEKRGITVRQS